MNTFQWIAIVLLAWLIALFGPMRCAEAAECLSSAQAVWSAHSGGHATWRNVGGKKCWRAGFPNERQVMHRERSHQRNSVKFVALSVAVPLPRDRPNTIHLPGFTDLNAGYGIRNAGYEVEAWLLRKMLFGD